MFIFIVNYVKGLDEVERFLPAHRAYLDRFYQSGNFIVSGRQVPRTGGIILCNAGSREEAEHITRQDPFHTNGIAEYRIIEFSPTSYTPEFEGFCR